MNLKLEIKRISDGVIASDVWKDWEWYQFWFEEGNARCDCNRELFFNQALKIETNYETKCTDDFNKFLVKCSDNDTGEVLYSEF